MAADSHSVGLNGKAGPALVCLVEKWIWARGLLSFRRQGTPMGDRYRWEPSRLGWVQGQDRRSQVPVEGLAPAPSLFSFPLFLPPSISFFPLVPDHLPGTGPAPVSGERKLTQARHCLQGHPGRLRDSAMVQTLKPICWGAASTADDPCQPHGHLYLPPYGAVLMVLIPQCEKA